MRKLNEYQLRILEQEKITCFDFVNCLGDFKEQDLPASLELRMQEHLLECKACKKFEKEYSQVIEVAKSLKPQMPEDAKYRLRKALNQKLGLNLSC